MVTLYTQCLNDACINSKKLIPIGIIYVSKYSSHGKRQSILEMIEEVGKIYPNVDIVVNCKFEWSCWGHPNNGDYSTNMIGDGYSIIKNGLKEL